MRHSIPLLGALVVVALALFSLGPGRATTLARPGDPPASQDPLTLVAAYYQQLAASANSGDFGPLLAYFAPDATIDSGLSAGGAAGSAQILQYFQSLPAMTGFTVETSNVQEDDPYVDVDWRWRAAPGSLRGYLDGHDSFTVQNGLITALEEDVDMEAAAEAFMPPAIGPVPSAAPVATTQVTIADFAYQPQVIQAPVGATVTWTNEDSDTHAVTTVDKTIDAGVIEQNVSISLTFTAPGTYQYYCTIHPGMRGTVIVGDGGQ
ncbi:MAG TPA: plastocyanin/azurin family copper-binding protein [Dehalococcoidia bacterium]|jgi:plastocyanin|nr:plastocyanin/azurin family copper-binding protein [Dehalococcoidia bacterium]